MHQNPDACKMMNHIDDGDTWKMCALNPCDFDYTFHGTRGGLLCKIASRLFVIFVVLCPLCCLKLQDADMVNGTLCFVALSEGVHVHTL